MVNGPLGMLWQPAELVIIFGSAFGAFIRCQHVLSSCAPKAWHTPLKMDRLKTSILKCLPFFMVCFAKMQREGIISIEKDIEQLDSSALSALPAYGKKDTAACFFVGDTLRIYLTTGNAGELDKLMGVDMNTMHHVEMTPSHNITHMAESMPAMGIVAAVLGVILTMAHLDAPPAELGHHIGAALAGTFLGVLFVLRYYWPFGAKLENIANERYMFFQSIREAVGAAVRGSSPIVALEYGRRAIPLELGPTFLEMEQSSKAVDASNKAQRPLMAPWCCQHSGRNAL